MSKSEIIVYICLSSGCSQHVQISQENIFTFLKTLINESTISTDKNQVKFILYPSAEYPDYKEEIEIGNPTGLKESSYNSNLPLKIIIHGFLSDTSKGAVEYIKTAYMDDFQEVNLIGVDWAALSTAKSVLPAIFYPTAATNVALVGKQLSYFLQFLIQNSVVTGPENVHLIGFSLGAHICGMAGMYFFQDTGIRIGRITGLDPAGPLFQGWGENDRLDKSDAKFVDITHTNKESFGFNVGLGHVDFYANGGGPRQPDCSFLRGARADVCSHTDAYKYFAKSLQGDIIACQCQIQQPECMKNCNNPVVYGERCPIHARGDYFLKIEVENYE